MADSFTPAERSRIMAAVRSGGNRSTEARLAKILRRHGMSGWRRHQAVVGRPDFVFRAKKVAVFVDGCFWHGCPAHCRLPATRTDYWQGKINRNRDRDRLVVSALKRQGWRTVRVWEHELRDEARVVRRIQAVVTRR